MGQGALDTGCHCRRATVSGFDKIKIEVVVGENGASHRGNADRILQFAHFFKHFRDQAMGNAVRATRAVVGDAVC